MASVAASLPLSQSPGPASDPPSSHGLPLQTVWETDAVGANLYQSPSWYEYIGDGPGSSFGQDWLRFYHPDDRDHLVREWKKSLDSGGEHRYDIEARIRRHDGVYRWFRIQGSPLKTPSGQVVKWTGTCTDIDEQKQRLDAAPSQHAGAIALPLAVRREAPRFSGVSRRLFLAVSVALLPLALLAVFTLVYNAKQHKTQILAATQSQMEALTTAVDSEFAMSVAALESLAVSPRLSPMDLPAFRREALELLARHEAWANLVLTRPDGEQLLNARLPPQGTLPQTPALDVIREVAVTGRPVLGNVVFSPVLKTFTFGVAVPVRREGEVVAVLSAVMLPGAMQAVIARQDVAKGGVVGIFDRNRRVVARSMNQQEWVGKSGSPGLLALMTSDRKTGWGETTTLEGMPVYSVFARSSTTGWATAIGIPADMIDGPVTRSLALLASATLGSLLVGLLAASAVGRTITRPIRALERAAELSAMGAPPTVPVTNLVEVRRVGHALFNAHAEREKLLQSERAAKLLEQRARLEAEEANQAKDRFLAMLGHELRGPLSAINSASQLLERDVPPDTARRAVGVVQRQVQQLRRLADDLMDAGAVVAGKIALSCVPLDLSVCVASVVENLRDTEPLAAHTIETSLDSVWVNGDSGRLEQIVGNLLINAGKYTPAPGRIVVSVAPEAGQAVLRVRDFGIGIDAELQPKVFDLFVQGHEPQGRWRGGLGIGLTLVRRLAELHGGSVAVASEGSGRGSEFVVRLPAIR